MCRYKIPYQQNDHADPLQANDQTQISGPSALTFIARSLPRFFQSSKFVAVDQSHIVLLSQRPRRGREDMS
jgi:hypothetical protein